MCQTTPTLSSFPMAMAPTSSEVEEGHFGSQLENPLNPFLEFVPMVKTAPGGVRYRIIAIVLLSSCISIWFFFFFRFREWNVPRASLPESRVGLLEARSAANAARLANRRAKRNRPLTEDLGSSEGKLGDRGWRCWEFWVMSDFRS